MTLEKYQIFTNSLWIPSSTPSEDELRIFTGIYGELGEVSELIKKAVRDGISDVDIWRNKMELELGDVMFYISQLCNFYDFDLEEIIDRNVIKLDDRRNRDVLGGSGDFR